MRPRELSENKKLNHEFMNKLFEKLQLQNMIALISVNEFYGERKN